MKRAMQWSMFFAAVLVWPSSQTASAQPCAFALADAHAAAAEAEQTGAFDDLVNELSLSPEQQQQIDKYRAEHREKIRESSDLLRQKRLKLKQELEKEGTDRQNIDALIADINALSEQRLERQIDSILAIKSILTPEQYKQLQDKMKDRAASRKEDRDLREKVRERGF